MSSSKCYTNHFPLIKMATARNARVFFKEISQENNPRDMDGWVSLNIKNVLNSVLGLWCLDAVKI